MTGIAHAVDLSERGRTSTEPALRCAADTLAEALADFASVVDDRFLGAGGGTTEILVAYARQQGHEPPAAG